jgi:hypothetical protein
MTTECSSHVRDGAAASGFDLRPVPCTRAARTGRGRRCGGRRCGCAPGVAVQPRPSRAGPKNPFGAGLREAGPSAQGLGAWILAVQGGFYRSLQAAVLGLKGDGGALWPLIGIGFAYGVFHAAGPGHGKAVVAA